MLKESGATIELELQPNAELTEKYDSLRAQQKSEQIQQVQQADEVVTTTLTRDQNGFGLRFGGAKNQSEANEHGTGIFISGTKSGSVAEANADIQPSLQLPL